jgi:small subunit ribosomal protein S19
MSRSKWKGSFLNKDTLDKKKNIQIWSRSSVISKNFLNKRVAVYNGKSFIFLFIKDKHIGFKFGYFSFTRKFLKKINKKKIKNKLKK